VKAKYGSWIAVISAGAAIGGIVGFRAAQPRRIESYNGIPIPDAGLVIDPQGVGHPGDPANSDEDFRVIYAAIDKFRHANKRLPKMVELVGSRANGFHGLVPADAWTNPDTQYADGPDPSKRASKMFQYILNIASPRLDGKPKPAFPKNGERDVWLVAEQCARENKVMLPAHQVRCKLTGCFVVLWSDGVIQRVPTSQRLVVTRNKKRRDFLIAGEAGIPKDAEQMTLLVTTGRSIRSYPSSSLRRIPGRPCESDCPGILFHASF
jgi:hypothetical protein